DVVEVLRHAGKEPGEADREEEHSADDRGPSHGGACGILVRSGQGRIDGTIDEHVSSSVRLLRAGAPTGLPARCARTAQRGSGCSARRRGFQTTPAAGAVEGADGP